MATFLDNDNKMILGKIGDEEIEWDLLSKDGADGFKLYCAVNVIDIYDEDEPDLENIYDKIFNDEEKKLVQSFNGKHMFFPELCYLKNKYGDKFSQVYPLQYAIDQDVTIWDANEEACADSEYNHIDEKTFKEEYEPYEGMAFHMAMDNGMLIYIEPDGFFCDDCLIDSPHGIRPAIWIKK